MPVKYLHKCNIFIHPLLLFIMVFSPSVLRAHACRPFHWPVFFARAQHVHHIIRQESIFNISEHHNPRAGHRGRLREEDLAVTWLSTREGQAARDWGTTSQTQQRPSQWDGQRDGGMKGWTEERKKNPTRINLIWNSRFIREHINAKSCKQMGTAGPALREEVVFSRNDDPLLGRWNHVIVNEWEKNKSQNNSCGGKQQRHTRDLITSEADELNFNENLSL